MKSRKLMGKTDARTPTQSAEVGHRIAWQLITPLCSSSGL